jgi:L-amino acid N-acyltransferase YncA
MTAGIRLASVDDLARINEIYNYFVQTSTCTYQEAPESIESRRAWFESHGPFHPVTVAEMDGQVVGWGSLSAYRARSAYRFTVENSVYVDQAHHQRGIGSMILRDLIGRARQIGHRTIIAGIDANQTASVALHRRHGFEKVGQLKTVGYKFDRWLDVIFMQLVVN